MTQGIFNTPVGTWNTTTAPLNYEKIMAFAEEFQKKQKENDEGLIQALKKYIADTGIHLEMWAWILGMSSEKLNGTLEGTIPVDWFFWERVKKTFEQERGDPGVANTKEDDILPW